MQISRTAAAADVPPVLGSFAAVAPDMSMLGMAAAGSSPSQHASPDIPTSGHYAQYSAAGGLHDNELFEPGPNTTDGGPTAPAAAAPQPAGALSPMAMFWAAMPPPVWGDPKPAPAADEDALLPPPDLQPLVCVHHVLCGCVDCPWLSLTNPPNVLNACTR